MSDKVFIDTNIFLYALTEPLAPTEEDVLKHQMSVKCISQAIRGTGVEISIQVVNELHFNLLRKVKLDEEEATALIRENVAKVCSIRPIGYATAQSAVALRKRYGFSFWDSMMIASALEIGASVFYSEDMQHEQIVDNRLKIVNPFWSKT